MSMTDDEMVLAHMKAEIDRKEERANTMHDEWMNAVDEYNKALAVYTMRRNLISWPTRLRALALEWYECCDDIHVPLNGAADEIERLMEIEADWVRHGEKQGWH